MSSTAITLNEPPTPEKFLRDTAILLTVAFSGDPIDRWVSTNSDEPIIEKEGDIPLDRLRRDIRGIAHEELQPNVIPVTALYHDQVAGIAVWEAPRSHWRRESLSQLVYRKAIEHLDAMTDWLYPKAGVRADRRKLIRTLRMEHAAKHLGQGNVQDAWYLKTLAVLPKFQRRGVGTALIKWGMEKARVNGEKLYVDASYVGKPLYLKLGFIEVGGFLVGDSGVRVTNMLWDPNYAS